MGKNKRQNYRYCNICLEKDKWKKDSISYNNNNDNDLMIVPCDCNPGRNYVHRKCQAEFMLNNDRISCERCRCKFRGLQFSYTKKTILNFLWEDENSRRSLWNFFWTIQVAIYTLWALFTNDWNDFLEDVWDLELSMDRISLKHNFNIIMMVHLKFLVPIISIHCSIKELLLCWAKFQKFTADHFNVIIHDLALSTVQQSVHESIVNKLINRFRSLFHK